MNAERESLVALRRRVVRLSVWTDCAYLVVFGHFAFPLWRRTP